MLGWDEVQQALGEIYDQAEAMPEGTHWEVEEAPAKLRQGLIATMKIHSVSIIHSKSCLSKEAVAQHRQPGLERARALVFAW
eukprot:943465-Lingulodinium_polyedra.AAC.1